MALIDDFLNPDSVSLKICGVTSRLDASKLTALKVPALGANFWRHSKRYLPPEDASWLKNFNGKILRIGVFVNAPPELPIRLISEGFIDVAQLHGDESPKDTAALRKAGVPFIKAIGVRTRDDLKRAAEFGARAILLDAHAPGIYGGTGEVFDWAVALDFKTRHPELPIILAGGIVPDNAWEAAHVVRPAAIDVASGAEIAPGVKDFEKVSAFISELERLP